MKLSEVLKKRHEKVQRIVEKWEKPGNIKDTAIEEKVLTIPQLREVYGESEDKDRFGWIVNHIKKYGEEKFNELFTIVDCGDYITMKVKAYQIIDENKTEKKGSLVYKNIVPLQQHERGAYIAEQQLKSSPEVVYGQETN